MLMLLLVSHVIWCAYGEHNGSPLEMVDNSFRYVTDIEGNRVPDFSFAGYAYGAAEPPRYPVAATVSPSKDDFNVCWFHFSHAVAKVN
jgi:hypothetical protein